MNTEPQQIIIWLDPRGYSSFHVCSYGAVLLMKVSKIHALWEKVCCFTVFAFMVKFANCWAGILSPSGSGCFYVICRCFTRWSSQDWLTKPNAVYRLSLTEDFLKINKHGGHMQRDMLPLKHLHVCTAVPLSTLLKSKESGAILLWSESTENKW